MEEASQSSVYIFERSRGGRATFAGDVTSESNMKRKHMTRDYSGSFDELTDAACLLNYCYEEGLRTTVKLKLPVLAANSPAVEPPRASSRCLVSRAMFFLDFLVFLSITPRSNSSSLDSARSGRELWHAVMSSSHSFEA